MTCCKATTILHNAVWPLLALKNARCCLAYSMLNHGMQACARRVAAEMQQALASWHTCSSSLQLISTQPLSAPHRPWVT